MIVRKTIEEESEKTYAVLQTFKLLIEMLGDDTFFINCVHNFLACMYIENGKDIKVYLKNCGMYYIELEKQMKSEGDVEGGEVDINP